MTTDDWNQHWDAYAESATKNPAQAYRRMLVLRTLALGHAAGRVRLLEIGSGQGDLSRELLLEHPKIELVGLELSASGVAIARAKVPGAVFLECDLTRPLELPAAYRGFATHAVCSEVLEHLDDPVTALRHARTCLAPGARLVVTVPAGPMSAFDRHIGHREHFTPTRLGEVIRDAGLELIELHGAGFPFFNLYRLTVVARGAKLVVDADGKKPLPALARAAMAAFAWLFRWNQHEGKSGWQLVATAVEPART